jgi:site-specific recombinase XerD
MYSRHAPALGTGRPTPWEQTIYAFLVEKGNLSGSRRTVDSYGRMLWPFFGRLDRDPGEVKPADIIGWAHGIGRSGRVPSPATVGARIACLSSYYRFLIRMGFATANPCDALQRPRRPQPRPRGLEARHVRRVLRVIPDTVPGRRDRAILLLLVLTGRRRSEAIGLKAGDIESEGGKVFYRYRGKGGKTGRRELPRPAFEAIELTLADAGRGLASMAPSESLWQAGAGKEGVSVHTFYVRFRRYLVAAGLTPTGVHVLRHTAAKLRRDAGESIESVSAFLDHSSLAVTTTYLRRLEGTEDRTWRKVAEAIGV